MIYDALVDIVFYDNKGRTKLYLAQYRGRPLPDPDMLLVINPPENVEAFRDAVEGTHLIMESNRIRIGKKIWATRTNRGCIELV